MYKNIQQDFQTYHCQVNEFIGQLENINNQDMIISITAKFVNARQKIIPSDTIDKYFFNDFNSLLTVFPSNYSDINRLKKLIKILLEQQVERYWYTNYPVYENDLDVDNDKGLYDLVDKKNIINFGFTVLHEDLFNKLLSKIRIKVYGLLNHPAKKTVGMRVTKCKPAIIALLNELTENVNKRTDRTIKLQVNSILRTVAHQKHLASLGYWAPVTTSHATGYAADIEREWYFCEDLQLFESIQATLSEYYEKQIINLIDEERVWHICLNPKYIEFYEQLFQLKYCK